MRITQDVFKHEIVHKCVCHPSPSPNQCVFSSFRECANGQALRCFFSFPLYVGTQWMYVYKDGCGSSCTCAACSHMFACTWRVEAMKVLFFEYFPPCLWDGLSQTTWIFKICLICLANELPW